MGIYNTKIKHMDDHVSIRYDNLSDQEKEQFLDFIEKDIIESVNSGKAHFGILENYKKLENYFKEKGYSIFINDYNAMKLKLCKKVIKMPFIVTDDFKDGPIHIHIVQNFHFLTDK